MRQENCKINWSFTFFVSIYFLAHHSISYFFHRFSLSVLANESEDTQKRTSSGKVRAKENKHKFTQQFGCMIHIEIVQMERNAATERIHTVCMCMPFVYGCNFCSSNNARGRFSFSLHCSTLNFDWIVWDFAVCLNYKRKKKKKFWPSNRNASQNSAAIGRKWIKTISTHLHSIL